MALYGIFLDQCNMSFLEKNMNCHLGWFAQVKIGTKKSQKIKQKNNVKLLG